MRTISASRMGELGEYVSRVAAAVSTRVAVGLVAVHSRSRGDECWVTVDGGRAADRCRVLDRLGVLTSQRDQLPGREGGGHIAANLSVVWSFVCPGDAVRFLA